MLKLPKKFLMMGSISLFIFSFSSMKKGEVANKFYKYLKESKSLYTDSSDVLKFKVWEKQVIKQYKKYRVKKRIAKTMDLNGVTIEVIGAAWCSDTRNQVSYLAKVLDYLKMDAGKVHFHMVDREKKSSKDSFVSTYTFTKVPVIIVYKNGEEIGSIIETPKVSIEEDLRVITN